VIEQVCNAPYTENRDLASHQLQRQRHCVQLAADISNNRDIYILQNIIINTVHGSVDKQPNGRKLQCRRRQAHAFGGRLQSAQPMSAFTFGPQWFSTGDQDMHLRSQCINLFCHNGHRIDDVVTAIEQQ